MKKPDSSHYTLFVSLILLAYIVFSHTPHLLISWDIFGYYLYLPFTFIYNDLGLKDFSVVQDIIAKYQNTSTFYQALPRPEGYYVMKYPMGMAVLYLPWFVIGHIWALAGTYEADGFSYPYQMSLLYGSFIYTVIGLIYFRKAMRRFFNPVVVSILLVGIVFGTNYMVLTVYHGQGLMSHNYLFFLFSLILWVTIRWHEKPSLKYAAGLGILIGLSALSRPTEILVAGIPLLWNIYDKRSLIEKIKLYWLRWKDVLLTGFLILFFGSFQLIYFKILTGSFLYNSYGGNAGEGMEFFSPYIWQVLFSYRKGWLLYTPLMALALIGFVSLFKSRKEIFFSIFIFFLISFYVIASWSCWWYADCFSQRAVIPMYVFLAIPLGVLIERMLHQKIWKKALFLLLLLLLISFNQFQSWQFLHGVINSSRMTKEVYHAIFLRRWIAPDVNENLLIDRNLSPEQILSSGKKFSWRNITVQTFEKEGVDPANYQIAGAKDNIVVLSPEKPFTPYFEVSYKDLALKEYGIIRIKARIFATVSPEENQTMITGTFMHKGHAYYYKTLKIDSGHVELNKWSEVEFLYLTPEVRKAEDPFRVTIWHRGEHPVYIDEVTVDILKPVFD
jgi:hypothetical protein